MRINGKVFGFVLVLLLVGMIVGSCADTNGPDRPRPQISSCPPGFVLICESRQEPSKGGADEEIPQYEHCRCEPAL